MTDAPETITAWALGSSHPHGVTTLGGPPAQAVEYIRADLYAAKVENLTAERDELAREAKRLREGLDRIRTPEAFYVATSNIDPEAYARMVYADAILDGLVLPRAQEKAEYETRRRYPLRLSGAALKGDNDERA